MKNFVFIILRGVGQVMFQKNILTGLLFLSGIAYNSPIMAAGALLGTMASTLFAMILKYPEEEIRNGLYGFNGTLVGIAVFVFFEPHLISWLMVEIGAVLSAILMRRMSEKIPAYTAPFVLSAWLVIGLMKMIKIALPITDVLSEAGSIDFLSATGMGVGQVMFQANVITGLLFLIGIGIHSRMSLAYAIFGTVFGFLIAILLGFPVDTINLGLWGYNAVLCGIALEGKKIRDLLLAAFAVLLSVFLNFWIGQSGVITLTAPFVLATWVALLVKRVIR